MTIRKKRNRKLTLQQPNFCKTTLAKHNQQILCHKCGAPITFSKDKVGPSGRKIPLDPLFNNEPHQEHCMYAETYDPDTELLLFDFLSKIPNRRQRRVIGAVGRAK